MSAAFIVYTDDTPFVMRLAQNLRDAGIFTHIGDPHARTQHILQADTFHALKQAQFVIARITQFALSNEWFLRQLSTAQEQSKVILCVQIDRTITFPEQFRWLHDTPTFEFNSHYEVGFSALITHITSYRTARGFDNPAWDAVHNPYVGLKHFQYWDAPVYTGRDSDVRRALQTLRACDFLAIIGASGSGKSSLVQAGILPQIRQNAIDESSGWVLSMVKPNTRPMLALWDSLTGIHNSAINKQTTYPQSAVDMLNTVETLLDGRQWLLVIDPLEHLFSHSGETERAQFFDVLRMLATMSSHTKVMVTLRSAFFNDVKEYPEIAKLFTDEQMLTLAPVHPEEIEPIIASPAQHMGLRFDVGLLEQITSDFIAHENTLSALQYALYQLFLRRDDDRLTQAAYAAIDGLNAINYVAEQYYGALATDEQQALQDFLLHCTNITQHAAAPYQSTLPDNVGEGIMGLLAPEQQFLIQIDNTQPPLVQITHPAVMRHWLRFAGWIAERKESLTYQTALRREQQNWYTNNIDPAYLLHGAALKQAESWLAENPDVTNLAPFILSSRREEDARQAKHQSTRRQLRLMATLRRVVIAIFLIIVLLVLFGMIVMLTPFS